MTRQQLMAMSKEQLVQAYKELDNHYAECVARRAQIQEAHTSEKTNLNSVISKLEYDFAIVKTKLTEEIAALKTENAELVKTIAALEAEN